MKNYLVKAIRNFNDKEEKNEFGLDTPRKANVSVWNCTKERYEYLKSHNAVMLIGIDEIKEEPIVEEKIEFSEEEIKPKATFKKSNKKKK